MAEISNSSAEIWEGDRPEAAAEVWEESVLGCGRVKRACGCEWSQEMKVASERIDSSWRRWRTNVSACKSVEGIMICNNKEAVKQAHGSNNE
eukprot:1725570-Rhodomonas_salina.3